MKSSSLRVAGWTTAGLLGIAAAAGAASFSYPNFSSTSGLTLQGSAATASTSDGTVLRVTPAIGNENGAAYSTSAFTLGANDTFSTQFQFRFTGSGGVDPADGITFVLAASPTGLGGAGVGMGYSGMGNSVAIEFDTYNNGNPASLGRFTAEPDSSNHVAIDTDGNLTNTAWTNVYGNGSCGFASGTPAQNPYTAPGCMSNGDLWTVNMSYDGTKLNVSLKDSAEASSFTAIDNQAIDIASLLGTTSAYVGFTAGTGAGWENHDILNWTFANTATLPSGPPVSPVPEPGSLLLLGLGLAGLAYAARRRSHRSPSA